MHVSVIVPQSKITFLNFQNILKVFLFLFFINYSFASKPNPLIDSYLEYRCLNINIFYCLFLYEHFF
jgi:hypothetical protein